MKIGRFGSWVIAAWVGVSGLAWAGSPPGESSAGPASGEPPQAGGQVGARSDPAALEKVESARAAIQALRSFGAVAVLSGDWSAHGGPKISGDAKGGVRYNLAARRADAGGWMIRVFGEPPGDQAPSLDIAFDGVTARSVARADKVIHEMTPANAEETRGFFSAQSAAAPVPWDLLAGLMFPDGAVVRSSGRETVGGVECDLVTVAVPDEPATLTIALGIGDHLPRRFEWRSGRGTRTLTLGEWRPNRSLSPSSFVVNAPSDFVIKPAPSPSRQARQEERPPAEPAERPAPVALPGEVALGKPAPAFSLKDPDGKTVSLESLRGSVVLMDFWATWCGPCKAAMPSLQEFHTTYSERGLKVIGINAWERGDPVKYKKEQGYTYTLLLNGDTVARAYGVSGIPAFFLIDRDGNLAWKATGWGPGSKDRMKKAIEDALAKGG